MNAELASLPNGRPAPAAARAVDPVRLSARTPAPAASPTPAQAANAAVRAAAERADSARAEAVRAAAQDASRRLAEKGSELTIEFEDALNRMVFRLIDTKTREVVRQIPSEEVLAIARALAADQSAGVLLRGDA